MRCVAAAVVLACAILTACSTRGGVLRGEDPDYFKISELMSSSDVKEILASDVKLYWIGYSHPAFAEQSRPETYNRISISASPFGGSRRHCVEAFERTLRTLFKEAERKRYDALVDVRPVVGGKPLDNADGFRCTPGYKVTRVYLMATFAMTEAAAKWAADAERHALSTSVRAPADGAITLNLAEALASAPVKTLLGPDFSADWHIPSPAYKYRFGPDDYSGDAKLTSLGKEAACERAVLDAIGSMLEAAKQHQYNMLIKIRSHLDDKFTPVASEYACQVGKESVSVTLQASLAAK